MISFSAMKLKMFSFCICYSTVMYPQSPQLLSAPAQHGRISSLVNKASLDGKSAITAHGPIIEYPVIRSLEGALATSRPLLVRIELKQSGLDSDKDAIFTWYKGRILDSLTAAALPSISSPLDKSMMSPPLALGPPKDDTVFIRVSGGIVVLNGVTVTMPEQPSWLELGKTYVVFVRFDDNPDGTLVRSASINIGDEGIFSYDGATGNLHPLAKESNRTREFLADIATSAGGTLSGLKVATAAFRQR